MNYEEMSNDDLLIELKRLKNIQSVNHILDKALKVRINSA